jgi:hypothetical protein
MSAKVIIPKMMPGQAPYTAEELKSLYSLVNIVAQVQEDLSPDELDEWERSLSREENND